jgi:hypothetical protein
MAPQNQNETDRASNSLVDWALELGCTEEELRSALGEAGRTLFELSPSEQYELDLGGAAA